MTNMNINIRIDRELKNQFEQFCANVGMSMSTAFTIFAKKVVREQRIPFEVGIEVPNGETIEAIQEVERMKADPTVGKTYDNVDAMMEDLLA